MNMNDPLGDMLTRIRNALMRNDSAVNRAVAALRLRVLDVLKSDIQSSRLTPRPSFAAMTSMVRRRWVRLGWRGFYRGATTSIMRAFLVSSTRFSAYEFAVSVLTKVFAPHLHPDFDDDNILVASESDGHDHDVGRRMEKTP